MDFLRELWWHLRLLALIWLISSIVVIATLYLDAEVF